MYRLLYLAFSVGTKNTTDLLNKKQTQRDSIDNRMLQPISHCITYIYRIINQEIQRAMHDNRSRHIY